MVIMSQPVTDNEALWSYLEEIKDPEIPVLSIVDLGIVREVAIDDEAVTVTITPTYTGCPAMDMIAASIKMELMARGFADVLVKFVISPHHPIPGNRFVTINYLHRMKPFNVRIAKAGIPAASVSLAVQPAKPFTNVRIAKNPLIILNATNHSGIISFCR